MKIAGILFDKAGTLLDFNEFWVPAAQRVIRRIFSDYRISDTSIHAEKALHSIGIVENKVLPDGSFAWKPYRDIADDLKPALEFMEAGLYVDAEDLTNKLVRYFEEESLAGNDNKGHCRSAGHFGLAAGEGHSAWNRYNRYLSCSGELSERTACAFLFYFIRLR